MKRLTLALFLLTAVGSAIVLLALAALPLLRAAPADAQGSHVELSDTVPGVGEVVVSFDLPVDYMVTDQELGGAQAEGPAGQSGGPSRAWLHMFSVHDWSSGTPAETAYELVGDLLRDRAGPILAEGPLTVGGFEGYSVRVRRYGTDTDTYRTELFVVVRVGGEIYVGAWVSGSLEVTIGRELFLESGQSVAQANQRVFDSIVASLTVSLPPLEEPTPTPTPTLEATPSPTEGERVEVGPIEEEGKEYTFSFELPEGYSVVETTEEKLTAEGPLIEVGEPSPDELWVHVIVTSRKGTVDEAARQRLEARGCPRGRPEIVMEGSVSLGETDGYFVHWACMRDTTTGPVPAWLELVVLIAPEAGQFLGLEAGHPTSEFAWTEDTPGEWTAVHVLEIGGRPADEVHRANLDTIVASLSVSIEEVGAPTPAATPTTTAVLAEGERLELGPIEEEGEEYTFSFELPEGYSIVELTRTDLIAHGRLIDAEEPWPDELRISTFAFSAKGTVAEAARQWAEGGCGDDQRSEIVAEGSGSLGEADAYWVHWACMVDTTTGPVPESRQRLLLIAAGDGRFVGLTAYYTTGEFWWTEPTAGDRTVAGPVEIGGRAAEEVRTADLDTVLASMRVSIEDLGAPQSEFVGSVPGPDEISTDPEVIGSNIFLALFIILAFAFTSTLFNQTLDENRREIEGWVGRFFTPFRRLTSLVEQQYGVVTERRPWVQRVAGPAVILPLTGLIYGFLSPDFGFNTKSVVLFVSVVIGVGAITYLYEGGQALFTTRRFRLGAGVKLYAVALVIAAGCVLLSRLVDFQPGFLFGFVCSYTLLAPAALDRRQSGQTVFFPAIALLALSVIAWLLVIPLREVTQGSDAWWVALPEGAAVAVFVVGLEGLFFNMIPLSFMDGAKIAEWNRLLWFLMFGAAGFLFCWVLLNQEDAYGEALRERSVVMVLSLLAFYSIVTLGTWAYFRGRVYGWAMPSLATVRGTVVGWARGAIERVPRIPRRRR